MANDLDDQLVDQKNKLELLHKAFGEKLASDLSKHKEQCAALSFELSVKEINAAQTLKLAMELDAALKEKKLQLDRKEQAVDAKHAKAREAAAAIVLEIEAEAAARAQAAQG